MAKASKKQTKATKTEKFRCTLHLSRELMERAKNISFWSPGLTLTALCEAGILAEVERVEKKNGGPFKPREKELVGGRPLGS